MLVVRRCFASIVARKATRVQHAGNRRCRDEEFVFRVFL
ncbi:hypothetical protein A2U01_0094428, partial [Trifolium medium]|nr:hypothetical protein [Trifolium medium]